MLFRSALDQCHVPGICNTATGVCTNPNANDGTICSDGNACTTPDTCLAGTCVGAGPLDCNDHKECTDDLCDAVDGCLHSNFPPNTVCEVNGKCDGQGNCIHEGKYPLWKDVYLYWEGVNTKYVDPQWDPAQHPFTYEVRTPGGALVTTVMLYKGQPPVILSLAPGKYIIKEINIPDNYLPAWNNEVTITVTEGQNSGWTLINVITFDLGIKKTGPDCIKEGANEFSLEVKNKGPASVKPVVTDSIKVGTGSSQTLNPILQAGSDTDGDGLIDPTETWTYKVAFTLPAGTSGSIVNTAKVEEDNYLKYYITDPWYLGGDRNKADNTAVLTREKCVCIPTTEICDGKDNDCDGVIDGFTRPSSCGVGACAAAGTETCTAGVWGGNTCKPGQPSAEICDGLDNDCDGTVNEGGNALCAAKVCQQATCTLSGCAYELLPSGTVCEVDGQCNGQGVCIHNAGCSVSNPCCSYSKGGFGGGGTPAQLLAANWGKGPFQNGLTVGLNPGKYDAWDNTMGTPTSGLSTIRAFLHSGGGTSGVISGQYLNPTDAKVAGRGGNLATQTAALTINIRLSGLAGTNMPAGFGNLKYCKVNDALNGKTVNEILVEANKALGSGTLPNGYSFSKMNSLTESLNTAFEGCKPSTFAKSYLKTSC